MERADCIDVRRAAPIEARRPKPPETAAIVVGNTCTLFLCIGSRFALSVGITAEILFSFINAKTEYTIFSVISSSVSKLTVILIFKGANS